MSYNEACQFCNSDSQNIVSIEPPRKEKQVFEVSPDEMKAGEFFKTIDFDGNGPVADFSGYEFSEVINVGAQLQGLVERTDVDVPERILIGSFEAKKI